MTHINLFGGPGVGKSTTSAGLFYRLKSEGAKTELIQEFAKDLTYSGDYVSLSNQLFVSGMQHHRSFILKDSVDYAIHDSPLILSLMYSQYKGATAKAFEEFIVSLFNEQKNRNYVLVRDTEAHPYMEYGRSQTLDESIAIDKAIREILTKHNIPFIEVPIANAVETIFNDIIISTASLQG